jgi:hypothetical protein
MLIFGGRHLGRVLAEYSALWVPETVHTAHDLLLRLRQESGMIRGWRCH